MNGLSLLKAVDESHGGGGQEGGLRGWPVAKVGLWLFVAVVSSLFFLLIAAYNMRMQYADWRPMPDPWLLWVNTVLLMLASVAFQWAKISAARKHLGGIKVGLLAAGGFGFAFLIGQLWAWQYLKGLNYLLTDNPANSFFYLITGLHGLHMLGGMVALAITAVKAWQNLDNRLSVELCAFYWHFLFVMWIVLFALLLVGDMGPRNWVPLIC